MIFYYLNYIIYLLYFKRLLKMGGFFLKILYIIYLNYIYIYNDNKKVFILYIEKVLKKIKKVFYF